MLSVNDLFRLSMKIYNLGLIFKKGVAVLTHRKILDEIKRNSELVNYKKSDTMYICGNGPSLKKVDFDSLDGDTMVCSDFVRYGRNFKKTPTYYLIVDSGFLAPDLIDRFKEFIVAYNGVPYIISSDYYGNEVAKNSGSNIYYYCMWGKLFNENSSVDPTKISPKAWNVVSHAIMLAMYLGYKKIYLLGCDYSLFATKQLQHCYDQTKEETSRKPCLREMLFKYSIVTDIHYELQKYAKKHGVKIINATECSLLDAYPFEGEEEK